MPSRREDIPGTIARSDKHAQAIYTRTHDNAVREYGEGERAHRTALASLKHSYKKEGDRWVAKAKRGPSDPNAVFGERKQRYPSAGGHEVPLAEWPKAALMERARQLDVRGRSTMNKPDLVKAVKKAS
ncbi:MAG TPA: ChaB family protein [Dehalococcoidia bacterium]|jgi:cation transport regulator ChaB